MVCLGRPYHFKFFKSCYTSPNFTWSIFEYLDPFVKTTINPLTPGAHLQLKASGLFKYVWPFSEIQALKG